MYISSLIVNCLNMCRNLNEKYFTKQLFYFILHGFALLINFEVFLSLNPLHRFERNTKDWEGRQALTPPLPHLHFSFKNRLVWLYAAESQDSAELDAKRKELKSQNYYLINFHVLCGVSCFHDPTNGFVKKMVVWNFPSSKLSNILIIVQWFFYRDVPN